MAAPVGFCFWPLLPFLGLCSPVRMTKETAVTVSCTRQIQPSEKVLMTHPAQRDKHNSPSSYSCTISESRVSPRGRTRVCTSHSSAGGCGAQTLKGMSGSTQTIPLWPCVWFPQCDCGHCHRRGPISGQMVYGAWCPWPPKAGPIPHTC